MRLAFIAIALVAGLLAGLALRGAARAAPGGRRTATAVLASLGVVLVVTCMTGRALMADALGVTVSLSDWLVLVLGLVGGWALGEAALRAARAGRLPDGPLRGRLLPAWPLLALFAAAAVVPAYAVTAGGTLGCAGFDQSRTTLSADSADTFPVLLSWDSAGGCQPVTGAITAQGGRYQATIEVHGAGGAAEDGGPQDPPLRRVTCSVVYALRLTDAGGHQTTARARATTCPG